MGGSVQGGAVEKEERGPLTSRQQAAGNRQQAADRGRAGLVACALIACGDRKTPPPTVVQDARATATAPAAIAPAWLVDIAPIAPRPELVAHAPVVVGDRVIIAGSRTDYRGLSLANGAEAWRRPGGASLAAPLVLAANDVVLLHDCDVAVAAPPGRAVLACFDRIDPIAIAARTAGRIHVVEGALGDCTAAGGAWKIINTNPLSLGVMRGPCLFDLDLERGEATRLHDPPPAPEPAEDVVARLDDRTWRQRIDNGKSFIVRDGGGPLFAGIGVLAAAHTGTRGAAVIRSDSSLAHDYVAAYDGDAVLWTWPLPAPPDLAGRAGPIGLAADAESIIVFFDASRVARFTTPWARPTAP